MSANVLRIQRSNDFVCHFSTREREREALAGKENENDNKSLMLRRIGEHKFLLTEDLVSSFLCFVPYNDCLRTRVATQRESHAIPKHFLAQVLVTEHFFLSLCLARLLLSSCLYPTVKFNWKPDLRAIRIHLGCG